MSKWIVITVAMVLITVGLIVGALIYLLKKNQAEEDAADELFLKSKSALLNNAVSEQLKQGVVATEGSKVLASSKVTQAAVAQSNSTLATALAAKQKVIDDLKMKYRNEMSKLKK